jgi:hypothetical protein
MHFVDREADAFDFGRGLETPCTGRGSQALRWKAPVRLAQADVAANRIRAELALYELTVA